MKMKSNLEYLIEFTKKHGYSEKININCQGGRTLNYLVSVVFNKKDIPSEKSISIEDIKFDVDSSLPKDMFTRWLQFCDKTKSQLSYFEWFTQNKNIYKPINVDISDSMELKNKVMSSIENIKRHLESYKKG